MPLFTIAKNRLNRVPQTNFNKERDLQSLIERNLDAAFKCRFVASEFSTGAEHAGRIDTLALSEDNNPVIIEYKKVESSDLVNQSLFYLAWLNDHRGDFEIAVQNELGSQEVDWGDIRVICIAPNYRKYDLHAVKIAFARTLTLTVPGIHTSCVQPERHTGWLDPVLVLHPPEPVGLPHRERGFRGGDSYLPGRRSP